MTRKMESQVVWKEVTLRKKAVTRRSVARLMMGSYTSNRLSSTGTTFTACIAIGIVSIIYATHAFIISYNT